MIALDSSMLLLLLYPDVSAPLGADGKPVDKAKEKIQYLVSEMSKQRDKIIIPTPALSEVLVHAGPAMNDYLNIFRKKACFKIAEFDERAAVEVALMTAAERLVKKQDKKKTKTETVAKVKYDRQIAAIAKVEGVSALYTDDLKLAKLAVGLGLNVVTTADLPLPPEDAQMSLGLDVPEPTEDSE